MATERTEVVSSYCDAWCERCPFTEECSSFTNIGRELEERDTRVTRSPIARSAEDYAKGTGRWLHEHGGADRHADPAVREAIAVVDWDALLIAAKLRRALDVRDRFACGNELGEDPVQNDWNGSAKVALISIERSLRSWALVHLAFADAGSAALRDHLQALGAAVRAQFPRAMRFRRPGFDDDSPAG